MFFTGPCLGLRKPHYTAPVFSNQILSELKREASSLVMLLPLKKAPGRLMGLGNTLITGKAGLGEMDWLSLGVPPSAEFQGKSLTRQAQVEGSPVCHSPAVCVCWMCTQELMRFPNSSPHSPGCGLRPLLQPRMHLTGQPQTSWWLLGCEHSGHSPTGHPAQRSTFRVDLLCSFEQG